jgi:hypothetical protein
MGACSGSSKRSGTGDGGERADASDAAAPALISVDPATVSLGPLELHQNGVASVTVTNIGEVSSPALSIYNTDDLEVSGCAGGLPVRASCTVTITAHPTKVGPWSGTVTIAAFPLGAAPLEVQVTAVVTSPKVSLSPETIDLGNVMLTEGIYREEIKVSASDAITDLSLGTFGPDVTIDRTSTTCGTALAAGASCVVVVYVATDMPGPLNDAILVSYGGATGPHLSVRVTGNFQAPATLAVSASQLQQFVAAPGETSPAVTLRVANIGDLATGDLAVAVTGDDRGDFQVKSDCQYLPAFHTCTLAVAFAPSTTSAAGRRDATLNVTDTDPGGSSVAIDLTGMLSMPGTLEISPDSADLGEVAIGATGAATALTVANTAAALAGGLVVSLPTNEFLLASDTCTGITLAEGGSCVLSVALAPTSVGAKSAILMVAAAGVPPVVKMLTGKGAAVDVPWASPPVISFGSIHVGNTSTRESVWVQNDLGATTGRLVLTISGDADRFQVSNNTCARPLAADTGCYFEVMFKPKNMEQSQAVITVTDGQIAVNVTVGGYGLLDL